MSRSSPAHDVASTCSARALRMRRESALCLDLHAERDVDTGERCRSGDHNTAKDPVDPKKMGETGRAHKQGGSSKYQHSTETSQGNSPPDRQGERERAG